MGKNIYLCKNRQYDSSQPIYNIVFKFLMEDNNNIFCKSLQFLLDYTI